MSWSNVCFRGADRVGIETILAGSFFSHSAEVSWDQEDGNWAMINAFKLPPQLNTTQADILIIIPDAYPQEPPHWFYTPQGLRKKNGGSLPHYFETGCRVDPNLRHLVNRNDQPPERVGWAGCCLHPREGWNPHPDPTQGSSLLTYCQGIYEALERWGRS